jgi:hypothetical protein
MEDQVMNTKLTLNLEKVVIKADKISPLVESMTGVIPDEKVDVKSEYTDYLMKKYA